MNLNIFGIIVIFSLLLCATGNRINDELFSSKIINNQNQIDTETQRNDQSIAYVKASIPIRIFQCMQRLSILKCMKIFILQKMERTTSYLNSGNLTADFLDQILSNNNNNNQLNNDSDDVLYKYYLQLPETDINERLLKSFQRFFHDREIKLHFIPGMVVKVVPSEENAINLSLKRGNTTKKRTFVYKSMFEFLFLFGFVFATATQWTESNDTGRKKKNSGELLLQLGVPAIIMPAILMGTVLPFILPALKFATIFSGLLNHAALISAIVFVAKQAALNTDATKHYYYSPGYHRSSTI